MQKMDRQTESVLGRITRNVPQRLARNTTKVVVDTSEEEVARVALNSPHISKAKKERIAKLLDRGAFRRSETVVNDETVAALDRYHTRAIQSAIRSGRLKDPMTDPFYRKRMERLAKGKFKRSDPLSQQEIANARRLLRPTQK